MSTDWSYLRRPPSRIEGLLRKQRGTYFFTANDYRVAVRDDFVTIRPKLALGSDYPGTEAFRHQFNRWLLEMFGVRHEAVVIDSLRLMIVSSATLEKMKSCSGDDLLAFKPTFVDSIDTFGQPIPPWLF